MKENQRKYVYHVVEENHQKFGVDYGQTLKLKTTQSIFKIPLIITVASDMKNLVALYLVVVILVTQY